MIVVILIIITLLVIVAIGRKNMSVPTKYLSPLTNSNSLQLFESGYETLPNLFMNADIKKKKMATIMAEMERIPEEEREKIASKIIFESYKSLIAMHSTTDAKFCSTLLLRDTAFRRSLRENTVDWTNWDGIIELIEERRRSLFIEDDIDDEPYRKKLAISFAVKGLQYRDEDAQDAAHELDVNDVLELEEEPDNEYDLYALKVLTVDGEHIGYVEATKSKRITENLDKLIECKVKKISEYDELFIYGIAYFE